MSEFKPLRSFEDRFTVKKTLEFGGCKLYAGVVRLNLDEKLLEASRVEFAREQAAAFVVAPNHLTDLTMLADEGHEVTALGNGWDEGTKNGPDRSALLGHNFVYQETKPHGFYSSYFHQRISS